MFLPHQVPPVSRKSSFDQSLSYEISGGLIPSQSPVPIAIKVALREYGWNNIEDNFICGSALIGVLNQYSNCLADPRSTERGCALNAARFISENLCITYCQCS
jgi:hypothetical protein